MTAPMTATTPTTYELFVDGRFTAAEGSRTFASVNPYTGEEWCRLADASPADAAAATAAARRAFAPDAPWRRMGGRERGRHLRRLAEHLVGAAEHLAEVEARDNGKLLREMRVQTNYLPEWFDYYAGLADKVLGDVLPGDRPNFLLYTQREPVGVVAALTPWNSPLLLLTWKIAPALAAGCTVVVKPSEHASASTAELARVVAEADLPPGVVNVVTASTVATAAALVADPAVDKVAFTGSTATGIAVVKGAADNLTRVLLELGGKSPNIVFDDADIAAATNGVISGIFAAGGQTCLAGSRLLAQAGLHDELVDRVAARAATIRLGNPTDPASEMGPMATPAQLDKVDGCVRRAVEAGAVVRVGGRRSDVGPLFYEPTVLTGVANDMPIAREEVFGPVLAVIPFRDEGEAIALANDSAFGLAAGVWTGDVRRAHRVAGALRAGTVWVNAYRAVSYHAPFGGFGASGWGRESGPRAMDEYLETKTTWIETSGETRDPFVIG